MYYTEITERSKNKLRTQKVLSDVLNIKSKTIIRTEKELIQSTIDLLTADMNVKIREALG